MAEAKRIVIEVSDQARARLKAVAALRRVTMRELVDELAERAEQETLGRRVGGDQQQPAATSAAPSAS